jgi:glutamate:Na+ symporter, ESS family
MKTIALSDLETLAAGLFALVVATAVARRVPLLARLSVPIAVVGGVLVAVVAALLYQFGGNSVKFATRLTDFFLLVFFTTVGLSAKFSALPARGALKDAATR